MNVSFLDLKRQYKSIKPEIDNAIMGILERTEFVQGKSTDEFEKQFAEYNDMKYCISCSSGTSALHLSLLSIGIRPGDEVILPVNTFIATAEAISHCGATPVFVDINKNDYLMNMELFEKAITKKTKVVIPVHLYGQPIDIQEILGIANKHGIKVVEDCAQSHGATFLGKKTGSFGIVNAFSFYPGKNLGAYGEAGAVLTNDEKISSTIKKLRDHGAIKKYEHDFVGYNYRMGGLQGAILSVKLKYIDEWNSKRIGIAAKYRKEMADLPIMLPICGDNKKHVYHLFVVQVENRENVINHLKQNNIGIGIHYPVPLHLTKAYEHLEYKKGDFPVIESICNKIISLPIFPEITDDEIVYVCGNLREALKCQK